MRLREGTKLASPKMLKNLRTSCLDKTRYRTARESHRQYTRILKNGDFIEGEAGIYPCRYCEGWHITSTLHGKRSKEFLKLERWRIASEKQLATKFRRLKEVGIIGREYREVERRYERMEGMI